MSQPAQSVRFGSNAKPPRVSIGMPAYNAELHIEAALDAILSQSFTDLELIISDNASTDRTVAICKSVAARDPRVRVLTNPVNLGVNPNYRKCAEAARGEFFKWASANDLIDTDYVEKCVAHLDAHPDVVLAFGKTILFEQDKSTGTVYEDRIDMLDEDPVVRLKRSIEDLRLNNVINGVIRRDALMRTSVHPDYYGSDCVVLSELALNGKFALIEATRFYRRMDRESATRLQSPHAVRLAHYPTERFGRFFQNWQLLMGYISAVLRSNLPFDKRMSALRYVLRCTYWHFPKLWADICEAMKFYAFRMRH